MKTVLVVDDEKIVRKGIINLLPWEKYGMRVIGEAASGKLALDFMREQSVDLLITDLSMPGLSGMEFVQMARDLYPKTEVVILTFHQDFEFIQSALRLGVLDYITKAQLEEENMDEILGRIEQRMRQREFHGQEGAQMMKENNGFMLVVPNYNQEVEQNVMKLPEVEGVVWDGKLAFLQLRGGGIKKSDMLQEMEPFFRSRRVYVLALEGLSQHSLRTAFKQAHAYMERDFYYVRSDNQYLYRLDISQPAFSDGGAEFNQKSLIGRLQLLKWVREDEAYNEILEELDIARLPGERLLHVFYSAYSEWSIYLNVNKEHFYEETVDFSSWQQWKTWLEDIRNELRTALKVEKYSSTILECMERAMRFIQAHFTENLSLEDVVREVNISRSYFSECFKAITGKSFSDFIRKLRIDKARKLLAETNQPVYLISENCGFSNDKYFIKVFKDCTGFYPKEYRKMHIKKG